MSVTIPSPMVRGAFKCLVGRPALDNEITLRPAAPHQSNRLYDIYVESEHLIAKEFLRTDRPDAAQHEYAALRHLESLQLAPQPVFFDPRVGPVVVYRYMEGEMWDRRVPSATELRDLAEAWLRFHPFTDGVWVSSGQAAPWPNAVAALRRPLEAYAGWAERTSLHSRTAARLCLEALERCIAAAAPLMRADSPPPLCFCRLDARFANVIARPDGRIGLVDWEDSGLRDPAREVADLVTHPNQEDLVDWQGWQPFLSVYMTSRRDDPDFELRLQSYLAVFPAFWLGILLDIGMRRVAEGEFETWRINEMEPNARLRRYLARVFAWPEADPTMALSKLGEVVFF